MKTGEMQYVTHFVKHYDVNTFVYLKIILTFSIYAVEIFNCRIKLCFVNVCV